MIPLALPRPAAHRNAFRRRAAQLVVAAVVVAFAAPAAPPMTAAAAPVAPVAPAVFASSFENGDPQPLASTPEGSPVNVTGTIPPGSLSAYVTQVTASKENGPGEVAANLLDDNANTKWLAFASSGWVVYQLGSPAVMTDYHLTTANDAPERDPKNFSVEGSVDGSTWTTLDTRSNQAFPERRTGYDFSTSNTTAYSWYRLSIAANGNGGLIQLADWDIRDARASTPGMLAGIGSGPSNGPTSKQGVGFSGTKALRFGGKHTGEGRAAASDLLFDRVGAALTRDSELSYQLFPDLAKDLQYPSTFVAVDLVLDDGTTLSKKTDLQDANGFGVSARAHGEQKLLFANQWNSVRIPLGALAGRTVTKILLSYDNPNGSAKTVFSGWVDDIRIGAAATPIDGSSLVNYVDTRRGTMSTSSYSRGSNIPAAAWPNGFNFFTPMTDAGQQGTLYEYHRSNNAANLPTLQAIGISHEPSIWMGDRNQLAIMPSTSATPSGELRARGLAFHHSDETARPDLYRVKFANDLTTEVTPTDHGGVYRFTFPGAGGSVVVDQVAGSSSLSVAADGTVSGWVDGGSGPSAGRSRMFVYGAFDTAPTKVGQAEGSRSSARYAAFSAAAGGSVLLRLATSFISLDQAQKNLDLELAGKSFDAVHAAATAAWNSRLGVIEVDGASQNQLVTLYSNLYRLNLYPNSQFENTGTAAAPRFRYASPVAERTGDATDTTTNAKIIDGKMYVNNGFWDTYRTVWPLYSLLYPKIASELVDGFVQQYRDGGWVARWSSPGYSDLMTGTSSDVAFAGAYLNGAVPTATALDAYDAALKNATVPPTSSGVGRKGLDRSIFLGYTPDSQGESVSWALEGYINDHGIGAMAAKLAKDPATPDARRSQLREESAYFLDRAKNYVQMFDPATGFFRAKNAAGEFGTGRFDPKDWWGPYTEANAWNFAFHAPFDVDGLAALYGGSAGLVKKLDEFFATRETGGNGDIHEMAEARDVRMGQLGMNNQVAHHIPYLYAAAGAPSKTQAAVREVMQRLFVGSENGQGYLGDEDNGEMSSWHIFSALGFYPLDSSSGNYTIGSPLFTKATVHLGSGKDLVMRAPGNSTANRYIQSARLNGAPLTSVTLPHSLVARGGELTFVMGPTPSRWGERSSAAAVPVPSSDITKAGYGTATVSDGTAATALTDDSSRTSATFLTATPAIRWRSYVGPLRVSSYTLTPGASGATPTAWRLEGSTDGAKWVLLDKRRDQRFRWGMQTRPFQIGAHPAYTHYRLSIDQTSTGAPATLAELELLTGSAPRRLTVTAAEEVSGLVGTSISAPLATISGGRSTAAADYAVTVDFLDGRGPQPAKLSRTPIGTWEIRLPYTFNAAGEYTVRVTVRTNRQTESVLVPVSIRRDQTLVGAFDTTCIGDAGVGANCDSRNWGFDRSLLADSGFKQGSTVAVPGTALSFDLPAVAAGKPDSASGNGRTVSLDLGQGATKLSVIGTATQAAQHETGVLTFSDGSTANLPIDFGDWVGAANNPQFGTLVVGKSAGRISGADGRDGLTAAVFATAPYTIPAGKTVASLTLPLQTGDPGTAGRIHVFAVASDGTRAARQPLSATAVPVADQRVDRSFIATLATATGGMPARPGGYLARVNWGDGTGLTEATVTPGTGSDPARVTATHRYTEAGDYPVAVTIDDGASSTVVRSTVRVRRR